MYYSSKSCTQWILFTQHLTLYCWPESFNFKQLKIDDHLIFKGYLKSGLHRTLVIAHGNEAEGWGTLLPLCPCRGEFSLLSGSPANTRPLPPPPPCTDKVWYWGRDQILARMTLGTQTWDDSTFETIIIHITRIRSDPNTAQDPIMF